MVKSKRGTPRRRKAKPRAKSAKSRTRAIVKFAKKRGVPLDPWQQAALEAKLQPKALPVALTQTPILGELGLVELKLTPDEERVLSEPVDPGRVLIKPQKTPTPYLPHPEYTKWFNRAFGRLGWALVPCSTASQVGNSIQCSYLLYVHGRPIAFAVGEQEYHAGNKEQTYGDALESTNASALRRLAKRMGVGLELWDRAWLNEWIEGNAVMVNIEQSYKEGDLWKTRDGKAWRRKQDPPLYNEKGRFAGGSATPAAKAAHNPQDNEPITDAQRIRFWKIVKRRGRLLAEVEVWLAAQYRLTDSHKMLRRDYDDICTAIEKPGPLPMPTEAT